MKKEEEIKQRYERLGGELNERTRRLFAANEAMALGWGGIAVVARATGLSRQVIVDGMQELREGQRAGEGRIRRSGGGRKSNVSKDPSLSEDLERLVEPVTRGDPESPLRWTRKRRNWWAILKMRGGNGIRRAKPRKCACMTSPSRAWAGPRPMGCTT